MAVDFISDSEKKGKFFTLMIISDLKPDGQAGDCEQCECGGDWLDHESHPPQT